MLNQRKKTFVKPVWGSAICLLMIWGFVSVAISVFAEDEAIPVVTTNADWTPVIETIGEVEMVLVPPGCFMMGDRDIFNARPPNEQCFDAPFWIGRYEATNADLILFVEAGGYENPDYWTNDGWVWRESENITAFGSFNYGHPSVDGPRRPAVEISWHEAYAYTQWLSEETGLSCRLPTEAEWEYAARGPDGLVYPWGDELIQENFVSWDDIGYLADVGTHPEGMSWVGAFDMMGNARELTSSEYQNYPYVADDGREDINRNKEVVARDHTHYGRSSEEYFLKSAFRESVYLTDRWLSVGFRVHCTEQAD